MSLYNFIESTSFEQSRYVYDGKTWYAKDIYKYIKKHNIKKEKIHIPSMHHQIRRDSKNSIGMVETMKRVQNTNLKYPIVMHFDGTVVDGYHRVTKAVLEGKEWIDCYRIDIYNVKNHKE